MMLPVLEIEKGLLYLSETHLEKLRDGGYMAGTGTFPGIRDVLPNLNIHHNYCH